MPKEIVNSDGRKKGVLSFFRDRIYPQEPFFDKEKELALKHGHIVTERTLTNCTNLVQMLGIIDGTQGIFKPKVGEKEHLRKNIPVGSYYLRERASYIVSAFLGFNLVPPTVIRKYKGEIGSIQEFIAGESNIWSNREFANLNNKRYTDQIFKLWVFDYIIWASDRQGEDSIDVNAFIKDSQFVAYDNGLSFNDYFHPFDTVYKLQAPEDVIDLLQKNNSEAVRLQLAKLLDRLIPAPEIEACLNRLKYITDEVVLKKVIEKDDIRDGKAFNPWLFTDLTRI